MHVAFVFPPVPYRPAVQSPQLLDPALEYLPGGHTMLQLGWASFVPYLPALHKLQTGWPGSENFARGQTAHGPKSNEGLYLPPGQGMLLFFSKLV